MGGKELLRCQVDDSVVEMQPPDRMFTEGRPHFLKPADNL
jgi:hypothetical protein